MVTNDDLGSSIFFQNEEIPVVQKRIDSCHRKMHYLNRFIEYLTFRNIDEKSIYGESSIQGHQGVFFETGMLGIMFLHKVGILFECFGKASDYDPVVQTCER